MFRRSTFHFDNGSAVTGGPVQGLHSGLRSMIQPCIAENVLRETAEIRRRMAAVVEMDTIDGKPAYEPSLPRQWVKAPLSRLSTSASRRDWFRLMQFNMMTDAWSPGGNANATTTPVHGVQARVPGFTRTGADPDAYYPYDPSVDKELPPFLQPDFRRAYLVNEIRYYDPDIVCLQEVNRVFFNDVLWKYIRYCGYGTLYQSSRGYKVRALRRGDNPLLPRHKGKIEEAEDIGNVVLFHKGRFVPILMPGKDLVQNLHFAHVVAMRDKITNMTLNVVCVQYTAGESKEAAKIRLHEARQTLQVLDALNRNDTDRAHMSNVICGDFNNVHDEEACVQLMRERFFSMHDVVGGPRWTTWFHEDAQTCAKYQKYYARNRECFEETDASKRAEREVAKYTRRPIGGQNGGGKMVSAINSEAEKAPCDAKTAVGQEDDCEPQKKEGNEATAMMVEEERQDALALRKQTLKASGIIYRTQDFVFYEPQTLALHQVLDVPEETHINEQQLLPCGKHPSHHIHLVADVSFTDVFPDVALKSLKD
ncbi:putative Endonuclease/Exonuclease/phosphatase family [Trypanosoma cruzi]|nr:putative Endonuclease/Exonuclease/phosphatase family [Trypanosoma cruzi]